MSTPEREMGGDAGSLVAMGATVMKIENETMLAVSVQRPRKEQEIVKAALAELDLVPEEAGKAYYSIPYRERQDDGTYKIVKVEGPSIGSAMALSRRWGNCTAGSRVMDSDAEGWTIEGVFLDYETNFRLLRPFRVSKFLKTRRGGVIELDVNRQLMAFQAGVSKAIRNVVVGALPPYLTSAYVKKAKAIVGGKPDEPASDKVKQAVLTTFESRFKVTQTMLEEYAERPMAEWLGSEIADLRGLWTALADKQVTIEEVWGGGESEKKPNGGAHELPTELKGATAAVQQDAPAGSTAPKASTAEPPSPTPAPPAQASLADF